MPLVALFTALTLAFTAIAVASAVAGGLPGWVIAARGGRDCQLDGLDGDGRVKENAALARILFPWPPR